MQDDKTSKPRMEVSLDVDGITARSKKLLAHKTKSHAIELITNLARGTFVCVEGDSGGATASLNVTLVDGLHVEIPLISVSRGNK